MHMHMHMRKLFLLLRSWWWRHPSRTDSKSYFRSMAACGPAAEVRRAQQAESRKEDSYLFSLPAADFRCSLAMLTSSMWVVAFRFAGCDYQTFLPWQSYVLGLSEVVISVVKMYDFCAERRGLRYHRVQNNIPVLCSSFREQLVAN